MSDSAPAEPAKPLPAIMRYFCYQHLPDSLKAVSWPFHDLALMISNSLPDGPERAVALRKLLESKDAAVRAALG